MPVGFRIASAWVDIRAEDKGLRQQIKEAVEKATKGQDAKINLHIDTKGLRREVSDALKQATSGQKPKVEIGIASKGLRREVTDALKRATDGQKPIVQIRIGSKGLRREVSDALNAATAGKRPVVPLGISTKGLRAEIQRALTAATAGKKPKVQIGVSTVGLRGEVKRALAAATAGQKGKVKIKVDVDDYGRITPRIDTNLFRRRMLAAVRIATSGSTFRIEPNLPDPALLAARLRLMTRLASRGLGVNVPVRFDRQGFDRLIARIGSIEDGFRRLEGPTGRYAHILMGALSLIGPVFAAGDHAIRSTGASLAVVIPMISALTTGAAAFAVGFNHMGSVISGIFGGSKKSVQALNDNLELLSPNARQFADALIKLQPAFTQLREDVQDVLFKDLDTTLKGFTRNTLPVLRRGLAMSALDLHDMATGAVDALDHMSRMGTLDAMFGGLHVAMKPIVKVPGQFLEAWVKTSIAATPLMTRMTTSFGKWSTDMSAKLDTAFENGRLQMAISKAGDTIVNFFRRIANNPEFKEFVQRMKEKGPEIAQVFSHIAEALLKIINALAPVSAIMLKLVDAAAKFVNALPPVFLDALIIKFVLFKAALGITGLIKNVVAGLIALKASIIALQSAGAAAIASRIGESLAALGMSATGIFRVSAALGIFLKSGLLIAGLMFAFRTMGWVMEKAFGLEQSVNVDKLTKSIEEFSTTGKLTGYAAKEFKASWADAVDGADKKWGGFEKAIQQTAHAGVWDHFFHGFQSATQWIVGGQTDLEKYKSKLKGVDSALADLQKQGKNKEAANLFAELAKHANKAGTSTEKFKTLLPKYQEELKNTKLAEKAAADAMGVYGQQALKTQHYLDDNRRKTDALKKAVLDLSDTYRTAAGDEISYHETLSNATETIKSNMKGVKDLSTGLDVNTKKGQENRRALLDLANQTSSWAQSTLNATGSQVKANKIIEDGRAQFVKLAQAAGATKTEAEKLANQWLKMPDKKLAFKGDISDLDEKIKDSQAKIDKLKQKTPTELKISKTEYDRQLQQAQFKLDVFKYQKNLLKIQADISDLDTKIAAAQKTVDSLKQRKKTAVGADKTRLEKELKEAQDKLDKLKQKKKAKIQAEDDTKKAVDQAKANLDSVKDKTVHLRTLAEIMSYTGKSLHELISAKGGKVTSGGMRAYARGGSIVDDGLFRGPGNGTSDSLIARVSNGEYIMRAAAVKKYGTGFMRMLNMERMPKFAGGGSVGGGYAGGGNVSGGAVTQFLTVKANTADANSKIDAVNKKLAAMAKLAPKAISIKATDNTKGAAASARKNFASIPGAAQAAFNSVKSKTTSFGNQMVSQFNSLKGRNTAAWKGIASSLQSAISGAYSKVKASTNAFSNNTVASIKNIRTRSNAEWNALGTSMQNRTKGMYSNMRSATTSFGNAIVNTFKSTTNRTGSAWGALGPKFKPPISYLIHTVLNSGMVGAMNAMMSKLGGGKKIGGVSVAGFARGGPIYGEGTATSDSIPARLSNGEYVIQAAAVKKFGVGFFHQVNRGSMPGQGAGYRPGFATGGPVNITMPGFASGGAVPSSDALNKILGDGGDAGAARMTDFIMANYVMPLIDSGPAGSAMKAVQKQGMDHIRKNVESFIKENFGGAGSASAGLRWAKTQYGKPYQWGGNGNPSWDCSGFMSAIESVIRGEKPHRRWATGAFGSSGPPGWKRNAKAPFQIGITNAGVGHTAGTIGKENVESSGGIGVHGGVGVPRGAHDGLFTSLWGYVGPNATKKAAGGLISGPGGPTADRIHAMLSNGEYVIRAAAVKKYGLNYLNSLNAGMVPHFASGGYTKTKGSGKNKRYYYHGKWYTLAGYKKAKSAYDKAQAKKKSDAKTKADKAKAQATSEKEAQGTLKGDVTFSHFGQMAFAQGSFKHNEIENNLGAPGSVSDLVNSLNSYASQIKGSFHGSTETALLKKLDSSGKALLGMQKKLEGVNKSLESAQNNLDDLKGKFDQLKESVSSNIKEYGNITKVGKYGTSPTTLLNQLKTDAGKATGFSDQLSKLKAMGVDPELISQIAQAGIVEGGATANSILAMTPEQVKQLNEYQKQLSAAADKAGNTTADAMYGAGIKAAEGLVKGLEAQQKAIEAQMMAIAKSMEAAIKKALGIKSPSRVMERIAHFTADGLENTLISRTPGIVRTMDNMVPSEPKVIAAKVPNLGTGTIAGGSHGRGVHIENINVYVSGTFALNTPAERRKLAKTIAKDVKEEIRKDDKAHR